ncbi:DUF4013 domain-containing protein [Halorussus amylolyticus]|uniref:DUF4013 domain-containing protein n=1 Tax=Halorussus amylolyticus TaxID=1126242 RepID=UPI00138F6812|nr:DUF4013 domain-containing protein [Halorussus amylolyticus]
MFETAVKYLVESDDGTETILVGGVLTLFAWLLIPAVFVAGYLQRVLVRTNSRDPAPSFDDWGDLFAEGLKAIAVTLAYLVVPVALLIAVTASVLLVSVETTSTTAADPVAAVGPNALGLVVILGGFALAAITGLLAWYALPAALARLALEGRLGAAFELRAIRRVVTTESYATGWLVALVVLVVGGALVSGLASIPFVGWALIPFAVFYLDVVAFALYGQAYRDATGTGRRETVDEDRRPAA